MFPQGWAAPRARTRRGARSDAIQIFNQSPRMWRPTRYSDDDFAAFREAMAGLAPRGGGDPHGLPDQPRDRRPGDAAEVARLADPRAPGRRGHRGARRRRPPRGAQGGHAANARKRAIAVHRGGAGRDRELPIIYENTAGSQQLLGRDFDEIAELIDAAGGPRLGLCIDCCHLHASGFDVRTPRASRRSRTRSRPRSASSSSGPARQRLARRARLQPRPPRRDRQGRDRAHGLSRFPLRAPLPGAAGRARDARARRQGPGPRRGGSRLCGGAAR